MPIGITEEHEQLRAAVRRFVDARVTPDVVRAALDAPADVMPPFWDALVEPGWVGLHVEDAGMLEQAVVVEELGRACAPGPYVPTAVAAAVLSLAGGRAADDWLPRMQAGEAVGAVALDGDMFGPSAHLADVVVCAIDGSWYALDAASARPAEVPSVDLTRRLGRARPRRCARRRMTAAST